MKKWISGWIFAGAIAAFGCGESTSIEEFEGYGVGMPGSGLPNGGEVLLEKLFVDATLSGAEDVVVNQLHAYQILDFEDNFRYPGTGACFEFQHPISFPVQDIPEEAQYVDWGSDIRFTGPGGIDKTVPQVIAPAEGLTDNRPSPVRTHKEGNWLYGGPTWQGANFQDVDIVEGEYTVDINSAQLTFNFPPEFRFPFDVGTEPVEFNGGEDLEVTWEAILNPDTPHSRTHHFVFVAFAAFPDAAAGDLGPTPLYLCNPPDTEDGQLVIPQSVIDDIPDAGIFQSGRLSHYMEALDADGNQCVDNTDGCRRFDMFTIYCAVSAYTKL